MPAKAKRTAGPAQDFYGAALSEAERLDLAAARAVSGIDDEIAVLRVRLWRAIAAAEGDISPLMIKGIDLLAKAVVAKYRLGPGEEGKLRDSLSAVLATAHGIESGVAGGS